MNPARQLPSLSGMTRNLRIAVIFTAALFALSLASASLAQENYPPTPPPGEEVLGDDDVKGSAEDPSVLPFTGGNLVLFIVAGTGLIVVGATVYRRSRVAEAPN
jgi:hypothetical protein